MNKKTFLILIATVIFLWALSGILIYSYFPNTERGMIGDMFGAINSLFSGLALVGIIYAILLQNEDLKLQKDELRLNREELAKSAVAQQKMEISLKEQTESLSYNAVLNTLSALINSIVSQLDPSNGIKTGDILGKEILRKQLLEFHELIEKLFLEIQKLNPELYKTGKIIKDNKK